MSAIATGRFWAIGVGPGDPELLTLKAVRILGSAQVVYHAGTGDREGRAYEIVRSFLRPEHEVRRVRSASMPVLGASDGAEYYRAGVEQIAADCRRGLDVALVTEGDPTLYSTAARVWTLLAEMAPEIVIEIVPGISAMTAAAARIAWPLAQRQETIGIIPAGYHAGRLRPFLEMHSTVCLLKPVQGLPALIADLGPDHEAVYLENVGTPREWQTRDLREAVDRKEYFSLVLVRHRSAATSESATPALSVVGLGPGDPRLLTRQAEEALRRADVLVGYDGYLKSLEPLHLEGEPRGSPIGAEIERAAQAVELARAGRAVAVVSSGDAGVYGMAGLVVETAAAHPEIDVEVVPGVTAATAAASLLGAPLGHDFCCISLSDLLTPWDAIEKRIAAAGQGDFVVALYNPISQRRTWQLPRTRELLLKHRSPETVVGLVDRAYRQGTRTWTTTLGQLSSEGVTMETIIIVGSSQTRLANGRMVTPRGYLSKEAQPVSRTSAVGERILAESFAIIERELGTHSLPPWAFAVVRRMIHSSADFEFARTVRFSPGFEEAFFGALREGATIVTDTEMVLLGIRRARNGKPAHCYLNDGEVSQYPSLTRSAAGLRVAARRHARPILAIGNAPTALDEALRLVDEEGWQPAAIIGMPVGFVGVEEAKSRLLKQARVPYLTCTGRKGGSAVTAAAVNALLEWDRLQ